MSSDCVATATPVMPLNTNRNRNAKKYSSGVRSWICPRYRVATQVKTLIAENTATNIESAPKIPASSSEMPATNMWWPQVKKPTSAIPSVDTAIATYDEG